MSKVLSKTVLLSPRRCAKGNHTFIAPKKGVIVEQKRCTQLISFELTWAYIVSDIT